MPLHRHVSGPPAEAPLHVRAQIDLPAEAGVVPRFRVPAQGMASDVAYQLIHDELMLDGNARLNLATFVSTWMDDKASALVAECANKNMIDKDEYPQTAELERRCVSMLADLWHASSAEEATGCSTTGSSEACMLGGLALKWRWRKAREAAGKDATKPNLVMGSNVQVCWEKFCRYWDVEARLVPVGMPKGATTLTAEGAEAHCDENTIGVVAVLGSTYDGVYEPVHDIATMLDGLQAGKGWDIPMHVDGASGGFVAPFVDRDLLWDFRIPRVASINTSGHKYGLVFPGVGWVVWRDASALPDELVFKVDYLGGEMPTFALNFSRPGAQVAAQYYNFLHLGRAGYHRVMQACRDNAQWLAEKVAGLGPFELVSQGDDLPVFAFRMKDGAAFSVFDVSEAIRTRGWLVPAYRMPPGMEEVAVLRVVVRDDFSRDLCQALLDDLGRICDRLGHMVPAAGPTPPEGPRTGFHH